jgi:hypothetical protein
VSQAGKILSIKPRLRKKTIEIQGATFHGYCYDASRIEGGDE